MEHKLCSICHEDIDYFAYGSCNHPTCTKCILKLRKFGSADEPDFSKCPTCRRNINRIVLMENFVPFDEINTSEMRHDPQYDFLFHTAKIETYYRNMLKSYCPICHEEKSSLSALNRHTTSEHQLSYCDLCIRYSRLLPCEFVPMKSTDLAEHRRWDEKRKKGHPLCHFCQERFYEFEDLVAHIRDCHFICDLCMTAGNFEVFREQRELLQHYGDSHHLCTECRAQQRISCFATADRLGLHRFQEHPTEVSQDPHSWLPVSIQLVPNSDFRTARNRGAPELSTNSEGVLSSGDGGLIAEGTDTGVRFRRPNPAEWTGQDFPTLGAAVNRDNATDTVSQTNRLGQTEARTNASNTARINPTIASLAGGNRGRLVAEDFPSLPGSGTPPTVPTPTWTGNKAKPSRQSDTVAAVKKSTPVIPSSDEFPGLPTDGAKPVPSFSTSWAPVARSTRKIVDNSTSSTTSVKPTATDFPSLSTSRTSQLSTLPPFTTTAATATAANRGKKKSKTPTTTGRHPPTDQDVQMNYQQTTLLNRNNRIIHSYDPPFEDVGQIQATYNHIQTVEPLPQPAVNSTHSTTVVVPELDSNNFPSLTGDEDKTKQQKKKKKLKDATGVTNSNESKSLSTRTPDSTGKTFTTYTALPDEAERNQALIRQVELALSDVGGKAAFSQFADLSRRYRYKQLNASAYAEGLLGLLIHQPQQKTVDNQDDTPFWIAPMLALLPDIGLQRALLRVLQGQGAPRLPNNNNNGATEANMKRIRAPVMPPPVWAKKVLSVLQICNQCGQVCLRVDMKAHNDLAHAVA